MFLESLNEKLWSDLFFPLFFLCGLALTPCLLRLLRIGLRPGGGASVRPAGTLSGRQAAGTVLAASVGIGNIVGTAQAVAMGGPGAVFWMWTAALFGIPVKTAEIYYGRQVGMGAMGYIRKALGAGAAWFYAALAAVSALLMGDMAQISAAFSSASVLLPGDGLSRDLCFSLLLPFLLWRMLKRGEGSVGRLCALLVPLMAGTYAAAAVGVLIFYRDRLPSAFRMILLNAFSPSAALGAGGGFVLRQSLLWGLRRGSFSNEAGLGSAANIHAGAGGDHPERHALWGAVEVSVDTLLLCTLSALVLLCSPVPIPFGTLPGPEWMRAALSSVYGEGFASRFLSLSLTAFGLSTVLGVYVSASRCAGWLGWRGKGYLLAFLGCAGLGCLLPADWIWRCSDAVNVLMAIPNLTALLLLAPLPKRKRERAGGFQKIKESALAAWERKV